MKAAQSATATILANYRTAEERNAANSADIAAALNGVDDALKRKEDPACLNTPSATSASATSSSTTP